MISSWVFMIMAVAALVSIFLGLRSLWLEGVWLDDREGSWWQEVLLRGSGVLLVVGLVLLAVGL